MNVEEDLVASIRKRPAMYVGDNGALGLSHLVSFSLDVLCGSPQAHGGRVMVTANRRGVRIEANRPPHRWPELRETLDSPASWRTHSSNRPWELITVLALSSTFVLEVDDGSGRVRWEGSRGELSRATPCEEGPCVLVVEPDEEVFARDITLQPNWLAKRAGELAAVLPGLETEVSVPETGRSAKFCYPAGMADLAGERGGVSLVPGWRSTCRIGAVDVDAAVHFPAWGSAPYPWISFANTVPTTRGGSHVRGLEAALRSAWDDKVGDLRDRALGAISVQVPRDQIAFEGPVKNLLKVPWLEREIAETLEGPLRAHLESITWR